MQIRIYIYFAGRLLRCFVTALSRFPGDTLCNRTPIKHWLVNINQTFINKLTKKQLGLLSLYASRCHART